METVLFGLFLTEYNAIKEIFRERKTFLNIDEETGRCSYRLIFILKILFVVYAFDRAVQKPLSLIFKHAGNFYGACNDPPWREIFPNILSVIVIYSLYKEPYFAFISAEFLMDIFVLLFSLNYAVEAYKKELQKISYMIFLCLFVQWSINNTSNAQQFRVSPYVLVLSLLFLSYRPMMPNNPKHRHRLNCLYIFMYIWVIYKLDQSYDKHQYVIHQNKTKAIIEERQNNVELERSKLDNTLQNLNINKESIAHLEATNFEVISEHEFELTNEISGKENNITEASSEAVIGYRVTEDSEVVDSEFGNREDYNTTGRRLETNDTNNTTILILGSNDTNNKPEGNQNLNRKKPIRVFNKRLGEMSKAAANMEKANELVSNVKSTDRAIQMRTHLKSKSRGNGEQGTAGENVMNNVLKVKATQMRPKHKDGTELQLKKIGANESRILITNKPGKVEKVGAQIVKSEKDKL